MNDRRRQQRNKTPFDDGSYLLKQSHISMKPSADTAERRRLLLHLCSSHSFNIQMQ